MAATLDLATTEVQRDLRATIRDVLSDKLPSRALRACIESPEGFDEQLWKQLATDIGLSAVAVPESFGGLGLGVAELAVVHQELGRALYPGPFLATSLATAALLAAADGEAQARWLPGIAAGELVGAAALLGRMGPGSAGDDGSGGVLASFEAGSWRLTGERWHVIAAHVADLVLVPARTDDGDGMFVVESGAPGLAVRVTPGLDLTRRVCSVTLDGVPAVPLDTPGGAGASMAAVEHALLLATSAEAAGGLDWCLGTSVEYAKTRHQFGRPIGSYQAVAHACVDMLGQSLAAAAATRYAAAAVQAARADAALAVRVAALRSGESYRVATEAMVHLLGGTGFTWEHDAHLYYRRSWSAQALAGGAQLHREAIARLAGL